MKLLVFASTPPPFHGQSFMVAQTLEVLRADAAFSVHHVNARLSADAADIGRPRPGKLFALLRHMRAAVATARKGLDALYYVPAPGRRGAIYRDWIALSRLRPHFPRLVLHWQAGGLGDWLRTRATSPERVITRRVLGEADLSIVLGETLRADAAAFAPRAVAVVRNGIPDPCPGFVRQPRADPARREALFLGLCLREKGLLDAVEGVVRVNQGAAGRWRLTVAGEFADAATRRAFAEAAAASGGAARHVGFVAGAEKSALLAQADVLLFPTYHAPETQGLVVAEALAFDLPVVVTRWRAVDEGLPDRHVYRVEPRRPDQIAAALRRAAAEGPPEGGLRRHFLAYYTLERYAAGLRAALRSADA